MNTLPRTSAEIEAILTRLRALPADAQTTVIWMTLGGVAHLATEHPQRRAGEVFRIMEGHLAGLEARYATAAAAA